MKNLIHYINIAIEESRRQMSGEWKKESNNDFKAVILVFEEPSTWGIDGGKISKLEIRDKSGKLVANFDRGWDVEPKDEKVKKYYNELIKKYN